MRSELAAAVKTEFHDRLQAALPQFALSGDEDIPPGSALYSWTVRDDLAFFLLLQVHRREDWFTIELAWSRDARWPAADVEREPRPYSPTGQVRFRLGRLWAPPQEDVWWRLAPRVDANAPFETHFRREPLGELLPQVSVMVADAIDHVVRYAVPYMTEVMAPARR